MCLPGTKKRNFTPRLSALHGTADRRVRALRKLGQPRRLGAAPREIVAPLLCGSLRLEQSAAGCNGLVIGLAGRASRRIVRGAGIQRAARLASVCSQRLRAVVTALKDCVIFLTRASGTAP